LKWVPWFLSAFLLPWFVAAMLRRPAASSSGSQTVASGSQTVAVAASDDRSDRYLSENLASPEEEQDAPGSPDLSRASGTSRTADGLAPGFGPEDRFDSISTACVELTKELVDPSIRRPVYDFCERRSYASSRYRTVTSKIDGSQVHDRDRVAAWKFYSHGIVTGRLDPENCPHHRLDLSIDHPKAERKMASNWPFRSPKMTDKKRGQWFSHPHDMERFGTRGPHDNNLKTAILWVPGCYDPAMLDRNDFNATVTILRAVAICEDYGCRSEYDIKRHWRHGAKRSRWTPS
jgi:hypothetical protein